MKSSLKLEPYYFCLLLIIFSCTGKTADSPPEGKAVVSAATPEAVQAGMDVLHQGGNAVDAAVAIAFTLSVTEPAMSGLGGGIQLLLALPGQPPFAINGTTRSPAFSPPEAIKEMLSYHRRSTIPSTVKTLGFIWEKYGSGRLDWATLLQPAIQYAERGFVMGPFRHKVYKKYEDILKNSPHHTGYWLMPDGNIPASGDTLRQPLLGKTLSRLAMHGAADFYQGEIAREIAADMEENDGWIRLSDLQGFPDPVELKAINTTYRNYHVYAQPPPCGGWVSLLILNLLEDSSPAQLQYGTRSRADALLKALYIGHRNRKEAPITDLVRYQEEAAQRTAKSYARRLLANYFPPALSGKEERESGETTHFSVVDRNGTALAATASINAYFGAAAAAPGLGFLYNSYMDDFTLGQPGHPFALRPGAMAYSSMSPVILQKNGKTQLIIGSPGSARIISTVAQLIQLWVDTDLGLQEIVPLPRYHVSDNRIYLEGIEKTPNLWLNQWRDEGFEVAFPGYELTLNNLNAYFGGVHAIAREPTGWTGVADPRRDGTAEAAAW